MGIGRNEWNGRSGVMDLRRNPAMHSTTMAIFENGAFKPVMPIKGVPEHSMVRISVETIAVSSRDEQLELLAAVPVAKGLASAIEEGRKRPWQADEF
jgi:hypothetical protein